MARAEHVDGGRDRLEGPVRRVVDGGGEGTRVELGDVVARARDQQHLAVLQHDRVHRTHRVLRRDHLPLPLGALLRGARTGRLRRDGAHLLQRVVVGGERAHPVDRQTPRDLVGVGRNGRRTDLRARPGRADGRILQVGPVLPARRRVTAEHGHRHVRGVRLVPGGQVVLLARRDGRGAGAVLRDQRLAVAVHAAGERDLHRLGAAVRVGDGGEGEVVVAPAGLGPAGRHVGAGGSGGLETGIGEQIGRTGRGLLRCGEQQARGHRPDGKQGGPPPGPPPDRQTHGKVPFCAAQLLV